jgi:dATP pyrophosphohydrolase
MASITSDIVEVCAFRFRNDRPEVLLLRRAKDEVLYPGMWQLVTGRVLNGETSAHAARRELQEETGLTPLRFWIVPFTSSFYDLRQDSIVVMPFFAAQVAGDAVPELSHEHDGYEWLAFPEAEGRLVWPGQREGICIVRAYILSGAEAGRLLEIGDT